jgi:hypothetical protein
MREWLRFGKARNRVQPRTRAGTDHDIRSAEAACFSIGQVDLARSWPYKTSAPDDEFGSAAFRPEEEVDDHRRRGNSSGAAKVAIRKSLIICGLNLAIG